MNKHLYLCHLLVLSSPVISTCFIYKCTCDVLFASQQILWKTDFLGKLIYLQINSKFPAFVKPKSSLPCPRHLSLSYARSIHSKLSQAIPWRSILILSFYSLPGFPSNFTHKYLCDLWKILEVFFYAFEWIIKFQFSFIKSHKWITFLKAENNLNYVGKT